MGIMLDVDIYAWPLSKAWKVCCQAFYNFAGVLSPRLVNNWERCLFLAVLQIFPPTFYGDISHHINHFSSLSWWMFGIFLIICNCIQRCNKLGHLSFSILMSKSMISFEKCSCCQRLCSFLIMQGIRKSCWDNLGNLGFHTIKSYWNIKNY